MFHPLGLWAVLGAAAPAAAPPMATDGTLQDGPAIVSAAQQTWVEMVQRVGFGKTSSGPVLIRRAPLARLHSGASRPGQIVLRQGETQRFDHAIALALRHEVAHQVLLQICPAAGEDRLFHEAFALAASNELTAWSADGYLSVTEAAKILATAPTLDAPRARRALARLLEEHPVSRAFPEPLERRLHLCALDAYPREPLAVADLLPTHQGDDAVLVLSRHSGEVLHAAGAVHRAMPFGSLLKPFVAAAHGATARPLPVKASEAVWQCHARGTMVLADALAKSCNGYFLDWDPGVPLGPYTPVLARLGMGRPPLDMAEAIGLKPTLLLSPWALAQAYRLLAASAPDALTMLQQTAQSGTLAGTAASALRGWAVKSGTVRDVASNPVQGWLVGVNDDVVVVLTHRGRAPRACTAEWVQLAKAYGKQRAAAAADVDVFGRMGAQDVTLTCDGGGWVVGTHAVRPVNHALNLSQLRAREQALCLGKPWQVTSARFAPGTPRTRPYAGVFTTDTARALRFRTTLSAYTAGVLRAEDASLRGPAAHALAQVIAHNAHHGRHAGARPCDTTHCQVFLGTDALSEDGSQALGMAALPSNAWLHFYRGGKAPWHARRARRDVEDALLTAFESLSFTKRAVLITTAAREGTSMYDEVQSRPCELLRNPLHLASCPTSASTEGAWVEFSGTGEGHGVGLDVEWAKSSGLSAQELLRRTYFQ